MRRSDDYYAQKRIEHRAARQAVARKDPVNFKRGSDGRVTRIIDTVATCARCEHEFTYRMTTKPRKYCPVCYPIRQRELKRASELARVNRAAAPLPQTQLIRYVGYDPTEQPLHEEHVE